MQSVLLTFFMLSLWITGVRSGLIAKQTVQGGDDHKALRFNVTLETVLLPGNSSYNVTLISTVTGFMVDQSSFATGPGDIGEKSSYRAVDGYDGVLWNYSQLTTEETAYLSFKAKPEFNLPEGKSFYNASLVYQVQPPINDSSVSPVISPFCLERVDILSTEVVTKLNHFDGFNNGLIAVTVIFGFLAGTLLVLLTLIGFFYMTKRNPFSCLEKKDKSSTESSPKFKPSETSFKSRYDGISAKRSLPWSESIITILRLPDQNDIIREIERLDIEDTMRLCHDLDRHRDEAVLNLAMNLIRSVVASGTASKKTASSCTASMLKQLESVERKMDNRFQQQMDNVASLGREEEEKELGALAQKHKEESSLLMESLKEVDPQDVKSVRMLLKEKHQLERSQLQYHSSLRKQEDMEKLVSDSSICKRVARRELIQTCLKEVATASSLTPDHLTKEFDRLEMAVAKIFSDAESIRLRVLEEKFAKRKCLVKTQELAQSQGRVVLNAVAEQLIQLVAFAKKSGKLSQSNARRVTEDIYAEALEIKRSAEEKGDKRELELLRKLGDTKKNRLADQRRIFEQKLNEIRKKHISADMKDSLLLLEFVQTTITKNEEELVQMETQIDSDHANDLLKLQELLREESKQDLLRSKDNLIKDLREIGMQSTKLRPLLEHQEDELQELQQTHQKETKEQLNDLRKQLSDGVVSLSGTRQHKHRHQEQLTTYKQAVVRNLINSQMALTPDDRERVQADLAKGKNNSATSVHALDKLKYRKMMEEKQASKKYDRIEMLRKKQEQELKKLRSVDLKKSRDSDDDEGAARTSLLLTSFENYYRRCLVILKGEEIVMDDEEVSVELKREQASMLKEEEEKLAMGLVEIQIRRMKEFMVAENERSVLRRVTCVLMRELAEGNVISVTDCQRLLQAHEKGMKSMVAPQRDDLKMTENRRKLLDESSKSVEEDNENLLNRVKSPTAVKLRKILQLENQIVEQSLLRNQTEREIRQEVEELKRSDRLNQIQLTLVKELELLAVVLKGGRYSLEDMEYILLNHSLPTSSIDWRHFLHEYRISDETRATTEKTDAKNRLRNSEEASQSSPRTDKADTTPSRTLLKLGKLHPLPASVSPAVVTHDEVDAGASSSQSGSYLYRKPSYSNNNPRLTQTMPPLRLPPITPSVGSKQKKSVRLVETHNEYWSN